MFLYFSGALQEPTECEGLRQCEPQVYDQAAQILWRDLPAARQQRGTATEAVKD